MLNLQKKRLGIPRTRGNRRTTGSAAILFHVEAQRTLSNITCLHVKGLEPTQHCRALLTNWGYKPVYRRKRPIYREVGNGNTAPIAFRLGGKAGDLLAPTAARRR